jgi:hypothetical protein
MKTLFKTPTFLFVSAATCAVIVFSCTGVPGGHADGKVTIETDRILIHPGAKIADRDQEAMNAILQHYDKSLYKIRMYKNGKLIRTAGKLSDMAIDKSLVSEVAQAIESGFSDSVLQISNKTNIIKDFGSITCGANTASQSAHTDHKLPSEAEPAASPATSNRINRLSERANTPNKTNYDTATANKTNYETGSAATTNVHPTPSASPTCGKGMSLKAILEKYSKK